MPLLDIPRSAIHRAIVFCIFLLLIFFPIGGAAAQQKTAPDFTLPDLSGNMVSLKDFRGKIVFVDFWATTCVPCRKSLPELAELDKKYRDKGLVILGLSVDDPDSFDNKYVSEFKDKYKVEYPILRADAKMMKDYLGVKEAFLPTLVIIDREGKIVDIHVGFDPGGPEKALKGLLESK
jgi:peroxiredoxin